jgi:hypothetical protein
LLLDEESPVNVKSAWNMLWKRSAVQCRED